MQPKTEIHLGLVGISVRIAAGRQKFFSNGSRFCAAKTLGLYLISIGFAFASLDPGKAIRQYHQDLWTTDQGLPQNDVRSITQTSDGYIWAATEKGLVRFDGLNFSVFDASNTPGLSVSSISALFVDRTGDLLIGTHGGGVTRLHRHTFTPLSEKTSLPHAVVNAIAETSDSDIWIATGQGLDRLHQGQLTTYGVKEGLPDEEITSLAPGSDDALWIGTHKGLARYWHNSFETFHVANGLADEYVKQLFYDDSDQLWIATNGGGLNRWREGVFNTVDMRAGLLSNALSSVYVDRAGTVWIGSFAGGIARITNGKLATYTSKEGLAADDVRCFFEDHDGNLWVGTGGGGLHRLSNSRLFTIYGVREGLSLGVTLGIFEDNAGDVWVGTNGGGLNRIHDDSVTTLTTKDGLADNLVFAIAQTSNSDIWIGSKGGLNRLRNGVLSLLTKQDGLPGGSVDALYVDRTDQLWVGGRLGLSVVRNGKAETFTIADGLSNNWVSTIDQTHDGAMWIGTVGGGLNRFADGKFQHYQTEQGLSSNVIDSIFEDADHVLWIGTDNAGLNRFKDGKFFSLTVKDGLPDNTINNIFSDDSGYLWFSSGKGVFRISRRQLDGYANKSISSLTITSYGTADGMKSTDCNGGFQPAGWKSHDGRLWIPTMEGVAVADPKKAGVGEPPPPVRLESALIDGLPVDLDSVVAAPPGRGQLEFHFSAPNFESPHKTIFKYKLEGFDREWVDAGNRRVAYYTNILRLRTALRSSPAMETVNGAQVRRSRSPYALISTKPGGLRCCACFGNLAPRSSLTLFRLRDVMLASNFWKRVLPNVPVNCAVKLLNASAPNRNW